jgi:hypothetical protein
MFTLTLDGAVLARGSRQACIVTRDTHRALHATPVHRYTIKEG